MWLLVALLVAGCSSRVPTSESPSPTPAPSKTSPEFINGGECPRDGYDLDPRAGCVTLAQNDEATLFVYAIVGKDSFPRQWRVRLESDTTTLDQRLDAGNPFSYPRALAAIDVNDDGVEEWLIKAVDIASHGTNWQRLELLVVDEEKLVPVRVEGEIFYVNVGGVSRMGEGARCDGDKFVLLRTWALDRQNLHWAYSERDYNIEGTAARLLERREGRYDVSDYNDPKIDPYYRVECGSFLYP